MEYGDRPLEHLYTNQTAPYFRAPHIYVALAARFTSRRIITDEQAREIDVHPSQVEGCSDAVLLTTRGRGNRYDRTFMEGFVRPGIGPQNWVARANYPALGVVRTGPHEMSFYVSQDSWQPTAHVRRYSLRLDGFAAVVAPYDEGELVTRPFKFAGKRLSVNYSTSVAGYLRAELQDAEGRIIPGRSWQACDPIVGNEIDHVVHWRNGDDVSSDVGMFAGKAVRLRIFMRDARLYSIQFQDDEASR